jgi:outer membrane protein assembly factor BamB
MIVKIDRLQSGSTSSGPQQKSIVSAPSSTPVDSVSLNESADRPGASPAQIRRLFEPGLSPEVQEIWKAPLSDMRKNPRGGGFLPADPLLGSDGSIIVGTHRGEVIAYKPDGQIQWRFDLGGPSAYNEPVPGWDGSMIFTNEIDNRLLCLGPDGAARYDVQLPEPARTRPSVDIDGRVVVGGEKQLHAIGPDGKVQWSCDLPALFCGFLTRPDRSVLVYGTGRTLSDPVVMQCVSPKGKELWRYTFENRPGGVPATGPDGQTVITDGTQVRVLDSKGNLTALLDLGSPAGEPLVDPQGRVYVGTKDGRLTALALDSPGKPPSSGKSSPSKGKSPDTLPVLWSSQMSGPVKGRLTLGPEGEIYCQNGSRNLTCVSAGGTEKWSAALGGYNNISTTVAPDGTAFVLLDCKRLHIYDNRGLPRGTMEREYLSLSSSSALPGKIAACDFDNVYLLAPGSFEDVLKEQPVDTRREPGSITRVGDWVIIDGVRVPIRKQPF